MLSDFLTLESYFSAPESALFFEDLVKHYTPKDIRKAIETGDLTFRTIQIGPDQGRTLYSLSEEARLKTF